MYNLCENTVSRKRWLFGNAAKLLKKLLADKVTKCKGFANLYYGAVRAAGKLYWVYKDHPDWCKPAVCGANMAKSKGDPTTPLNV